MGIDPSSAEAPRLRPLPEGYAGTRESLHRLAELVVKPAREQTTGEWTLTPTPGGFGTPLFGEDSQVRVELDELVVRIRGEERRQRITSLAAAAELAAMLLPDGLELSDEPIEVDADRSRALGDAFAFGQAVLETLAGEVAEGDDPTAPTLWPEHFDIAIESGPDALGRRVNYGLSPGDEHHDEPYLYVGPHTAKPTGELWNGIGFTGAELGYAELQAADDQLGAALEFCRLRMKAINEMELGE
jgi:hypothetical protein